MKGFDDLQKALSELSGDDAVKAMSAAAREAMMVVKENAERSAAQFDDPETPSRIADLVGVRSKRQKGHVWIGVGIEGGASSKDKDHPFYWRFRELGTRHEPARPFLRPALYNNQQQVINALSEELEKRLIKQRKEP